jgi:hypothetical protein
MRTTPGGSRYGGIAHVSPSALDPARADVGAARDVPVLAFARVPWIVGTPVVDNPSFTDVPNTMMYTVTVTVSAIAADVDHVAKVGFTDDYQSCRDPTTIWKWAPEQTFDTTDTRTWTLYNFQPGTAYYYKVQIGGASASTHRWYCGALATTDVPTPTIPTALAALDLEFHKAGDREPVRHQVRDPGDR